jgi:hypothetical protein
MQPPFPISQLAILSKVRAYQETVEKLLDNASEQNLEEAWEEIPFVRKTDLRERFPESFGFTREELTEMVISRKSRSNAPRARPKNRWSSSCPKAGGPGRKRGL